ncbi:MAG: hypothetical protein QXR36_03710, partial [Desulfurococcaceae archaeon]
MKALLLFGSSIHGLWIARDVDIMVVVDKFSSVEEKLLLETLIAKSLRKLLVRKPVDVLVFDVESFMENLEPGAVASGLVAGYILLYDELGVESLVKNLAEKVARDDVVLFKHGKRLNLSAIARAKLCVKLRTTGSP